jgi:3-deoxy-manno-octulosonate cytidylyltransferase (CMP-KDO synthetase)
MVRVVKKKVIGLIPVRLKSRRLKEKPLLKLANYPLFVHVYRRAKLSKKLDDVIVCCDDKRIFKVAKKYNIKCLMTSKKHKNGTERIYEGYIKNKKQYDLIVDIQGDEPLLDPKHIDKVIEFHIKNMDADIVLPSLKIKKKKNNKSIVKVVTNSNNQVMYLSRAKVPFYFKKNCSFYEKHLSIISFKRNSLSKYAKKDISKLEKIEGIELLRALEMNLKIKSFNISGESFSVDIKSDYILAKKKIITDKSYQIYKNKFYN